jgi:hypothetical protein
MVAPMIGSLSWTPKMRQLASVMGLLVSSGFLAQPHMGLWLLKIGFPAVDPVVGASSLFGAERPFFVPSPALGFPERAEGVKGPKR